MDLNDYTKDSLRYSASSLRLNFIQQLLIKNFHRTIKMLTHPLPLSKKRGVPLRISFNNLVACFRIISPNDKLIKSNIAIPGTPSCKSVVRLRSSLGESKSLLLN